MLNIDNAAILLGALGNKTRLTIFKILIQAGKSGLNPGYISKELSLEPNKLSFHLNHLKKIDLIVANKQGRTMLYQANYDKIKDVIEFLYEKCCIGDKAN